MRGKVLEWAFRICIMLPIGLPGWLAIKFGELLYIPFFDWLQDVARWLGGGKVMAWERRKAWKGYNAAAGENWLVEKWW